MNTDLTEIVNELLKDPLFDNIRDTIKKRIEAIRLPDDICITTKWQLVMLAGDNNLFKIFSIAVNIILGPNQIYFLQTNNNDSIFHFAALSGNYEFFESIYTKYNEHNFLCPGPYPWKDKQDRTILHYLANNNDSDFLNKTLPNLSYNLAETLLASDAQEMNLLHYFVKRNNQDMVEKLIINYPDIYQINENINYMNLAAKHNSQETLMWFLQNYQYENTFPNPHVVHIVAQHGHFDLLKKLLAWKEDYIKKLAHLNLKKGISNYNSYSARSGTVVYEADLLCFALYGGKKDIVDYLILRKKSKDLPVRNIKKYLIAADESNNVELLSRVMQKALPLDRKNFSTWFFEKIEQCSIDVEMNLCKKLGSFFLFHAIYKVEKISYEPNVKRPFMPLPEVGLMRLNEKADFYLRNKIFLNKYLALFTLHYSLIIKSENERHQKVFNLFRDLIQSLNKQHQNNEPHYSDTIHELLSVVFNNPESTIPCKSLKILLSIEKEILDEIVPQYLDYLYNSHCDFLYPDEELLINKLKDTTALEAISITLCQSNS